MPIEQQPFRKYNLDEEGKKVDSFTIRLNLEERKQLEEDKEVLEQKKDSTAMKQLTRIGSIVIHDKKIAQILGVVIGNRRRNKRTSACPFQS